MRETLYKFPITIADLQASPHPTLAYHGAEDTFVELAREQANALPCRHETVPGSHSSAIAQAGNILPAAIAQLDAARKDALVSD